MGSPLESGDEVQPRFNIKMTLEIIERDSYASTYVRLPSLGFDQIVSVQINRPHRNMVPKSDIEIGLKAHLWSKGPRVDMGTDVELVGIHRDTSSHTPAFEAQSRLDLGRGSIAPAEEKDEGE